MGQSQVFGFFFRGYTTDPIGGDIALIKLQRSNKDGQMDTVESTQFIALNMNIYDMGSATPSSACYIQSSYPDFLFSMD